MTDSTTPALNLNSIDLGEDFGKRELAVETQSELAKIGDFDPDEGAAIWEQHYPGAGIDSEEGFVEASVTAATSAFLNQDQPEMIKSLEVINNIGKDEIWDTAQGDIIRDVEGVVATYMGISRDEAEVALATAGEAAKDLTGDAANEEFFAVLSNELDKVGVSVEDAQNFFSLKTSDKMMYLLRVAYGPEVDFAQPAVAAPATTATTTTATQHTTTNNGAIPQEHVAQLQAVEAELKAGQQQLQEDAAELEGQRQKLVQAEQQLQVEAAKIEAAGGAKKTTGGTTIQNATADVNSILQTVTNLAQVGGAFFGGNSTNSAQPQQRPTPASGVSNRGAGYAEDLARNNPPSNQTSLFTEDVVGTDESVFSSGPLDLDQFKVAGFADSSLSFTGPLAPIDLDSTTTAFGADIDIDYFGSADNSFSFDTDIAVDTFDIDGEDFAFTGTGDFDFNFD